MSMQPLSADKLRRFQDPDAFTFETTAEVPASIHIIGQPRGTRAIEFGIGIQSQGYNIYVLGKTGTGRTTAIERFLEERSHYQPTPDDWIYVHNFTVPHQPRAVELPAGQGIVFRARMVELIASLRIHLPRAFDTERYRETIEAMRQTFESQRHELLQGLQRKATAAGFTLFNTPSGYVVAPMGDGQPASPADQLQVPVAQQLVLEQEYQTLTGELEDALQQIHQLEQQTRRQIKQVDRQVADAAMQHHFEKLRALHQGQAEMLLYLEEVRQDVLNQIDDFTLPLESAESIDLSRYEVNVIIDNSRTTGPPVIAESNPTFHNLFGRLEYEVRAGHLSTHFTNIRSGSLHRANGGYLIMQAEDLLRDRDTWETLKRALRTQEIQVQPRATMDTGQVLAKSLDPEPIPLSLKVILVGSLSLYYQLHEQDEDFGTLFKVRADFDSTMPCDKEHVEAYSLFVASRCHEEKLPHFDRTAVAKVVEYGSRLAEHQQKLSTLFGAIADLIRESSYWATYNEHKAVTAADVQQALAERTHRASRMEEEILEQVLEGSIFIVTDGSVIGQINGLAIIDTGDYSFGQPGRISARTFMGEEGVVHIERETEMSGPIHEKGVLTLTGYLGGTYAQHQPLSLTASLTFEQNYVSIDGDSASCGELYTILSSLSEVPLRQGIGVTGSVNQRGEVQPIGSVNEKIEGFFRLCQARGLSGEQGVIIPASNVNNLMLHEDVVTAVCQGKFHVWPINHIDEGIELLTGIPAGRCDEHGNYPEGTVHHMVQQRLFELARELNKFGEDDDGDDDEE
ncbi:MAG TPA: ATP-binding protein [Anaerolineae bacterium]